MLKMNHQKDHEYDEKSEPTFRPEKTVVRSALAGLVLFTGLAGSAEASVLTVQEKISVLRNAEPASIQGGVLNSVLPKAASRKPGDGYSQAYTQTYNQTYTQGMG
jgi:hypothetical protein